MSDRKRKSAKAQASPPFVFVDGTPSDALSEPIRLKVRGLIAGFLDEAVGASNQSGEPTARASLMPAETVTPNEILARVVLGSGLVRRTDNSVRPNIFMPPAGSNRISAHRRTRMSKEEAVRYAM